MIYLLGAILILVCILEAFAIAFWWASMKRIPKLERGWDTVNRDLDDAEEKRRKELQ